MIRPYLIDQASPLLGDQCALCKQAFGPGDEIVVCPQDGSRHHVFCWQANGNRCTMLGCTGAGEVVGPPRRIRPQRQPRRAARPQGVPVRESNGRSKVRVLPETNVSFAQTCLIVAIAIAIIFFAMGCFGLWAIADYIMLEVLGWQYRAPLDGAWLPLGISLLWL